MRISAFIAYKKGYENGNKKKNDDEKMYVNNDSDDDEYSLDSEFM